MKNIVIPILGAVSIVSTGALAWLLATPPSVDPRAVKLETELQEARQTIAKLKAELARKPVSTLAGATSSGTPAGVVPVPDDATAAATVPAPPASFREMLNKPGMRNLIDQQQAAQIEVGYGKLFERLRLGPEDREHFKKLLTARQKAMTDLGLQLMDPNLSDAKRKEIMAEANHQQSVYDASIKDFLNAPSDWGTFQQWERTQPERTTFDTIGRGLYNASGEPLSSDQEEQLITLMAESRTNAGTVAGLNQLANGDPSKITEAMLAQQIDKIKDTHRIIMEKAAGFLTPGQLRTQQAYLDQVLTLAQSGQWFLRGAGR